MSIYLQHAVLRDPARMAPFGIVSQDRLYLFSHTAEPKLIRTSDTVTFSPAHGFYVILHHHPFVLSKIYMIDTI